MRGSDERNGSLFSYVNLEERIPARHPLRKLLAIVNDALATLDAEFSSLYAVDGRPSIAPERLLRAALIQILFSIRSERQLMEQLQYNLLFRWFVGLGIDDPVWVPTVFTKNRDRLLNTDIARKFLAAILAHESVAPLLSDEHFSVDGTLVEAWASMKSFQPKPPEGPADGPPPPHTGGAEAKGPPPQDQGTDASTAPATPSKATSETPPMTNTDESKDRNAEVDFRGQKRSNETHRSVTDPQARLYRKGRGKPAQLCFMGHALMENRSGLIVQAELTQADGHAERAAALVMIERQSPGSERRLTLGADKGYDAASFVGDLRRMCVTPHVAAKAKGSAIDGRTTRHAGYSVSQKKRKQIEEAFGWGKTVGQMRKTMLRGVARVAAQFTFNIAGYNLARLPKLLGA
ncbi:MAG: IS5 family transposase [Sphingomonadales bacterium]|nr:IS5 family transposase [Sphingomonadales bacterium]